MTARLTAEALASLQFNAERAIAKCEVCSQIDPAAVAFEDIAHFVKCGWAHSLLRITRQAAHDDRVRTAFRAWLDRQSGPFSHATIGDAIAEIDRLERETP